jgi:hypothetical protein
MTWMFIIGLVYTGHAVGLVKKGSCPLVLHKPNTLVIHEDKMMFKNKLTYCNVTTYIYSEYNRQDLMNDWVEKTSNMTVYHTVWGQYNNVDIQRYYMIHALFLFIMVTISIAIHMNS